MSESSREMTLEDAVEVAAAACEYGVTVCLDTKTRYVCPAHHVCKGNEQTRNYIATITALRAELAEERYRNDAVENGLRASMAAELELRGANKRLKVSNDELRAENERLLEVCRWNAGRTDAELALKEACAQFRALWEAADALRHHWSPEGVGPIDGDYYTATHDEAYAFRVAVETLRPLMESDPR